MMVWCVLFSWTFLLAISVQLHITAAFLPLADNARNVSPRPLVQANKDNRRFRASRTIICSSKRVATSPIREEIRYIAGRRALLLHPPIKPNISNNNPPLVILGGMAQSISSWEFHLPYLSQNRSVLIYEALGQGPPPPNEVCSIDGKEITPEQYYDDVSLERQGKDFWKVVDDAFFAPGSYHYEQRCEDASEINDDLDNVKEVVDVASFSFGGRVAMAAASLTPNRIRRLHLTGVGAERDALANLHLASWKDILGLNYNDNDDDDDDVEIEEECDPINHASRCTSRLRSFAWSVILATYSEHFLAAAGPERVKTWVDSVCQYNTEEGLRAILLQTHSEKGENQQPDLWTPAAMAQRIQSSQSIENCRVLVGSQDKMAHPKQALQLANILHNCDGAADEILENGIYRVIEGCGHAVPMEAMRLWRGDVLEFLNL